MKTKAKPERSILHWQTIDYLAKKHGLSTSGLAKKAGLDPTAFNKSKRVSPDGRHRFPSLETIELVTDALEISLTDYAKLIDSPSLMGSSRDIGRV